MTRRECRVTPVLSLSKGLRFTRSTITSRPGPCWLNVPFGGYIILIFSYTDVPYLTPTWTRENASQFATISILSTGE